MLKTLRDQFVHLKWILWFVVFLFVFFIFVDWGTGRGRTRGLAGLAARIGNVSISEAQFTKEVRSTEQRYRQMYGDQFDSIRDKMDLASITIQNIVDRYLLLAEARKLGIEVTDKELLDKIMSYPAFKRSDGSFVGDDLYARILRANQTSPEEFEEGLRQDLTMQKLQQTLSDGVVIPDADVEREYRRRNESASFEVLFVPVERALTGVTVTEADAKAYYEANQARFTHPEQHQLRYLLVDDAKLRRTLSVPDAQITSYYASHQQEFAAPEQVRARHILVRPKTEDQAGWATALAKAREVRDKAVKGDFAALAKQYSEDPGSKDTGGELGWFPRGRMDKDFENAAFGLKPGEVSDPVKSRYGYHIIQLEERRAASVRPLAEVREIIKEKLLEGMSDAEGNRRATALRDKIDAAKLTTDEQWHTLADDVVTSNVTPFFGPQDEMIPGLGRDPELLAEAKAAKEGFIGGPRRSSRGWIVYRVAKIRPAGTAPFAEAKDEAMEAARRVRALETLRAELDAKRPALTGGPLAGQAAALGGSAQSVTDHRRDTAIPGIGAAPLLDDAVFATAVNALTPAIPVGERGVAIARVTSKKAFDPAAFAKEKPALRDSMVREEMLRLISSMIAEAKRENPVTINPDVVDRFKPKRS
ncbi:MAG TPA: peptidyl-prolyl cis-trans isomerase [Thermoanaerobaculaceae bacterium]|nr:peptidyl-prolyl cis-trans isomerase [Thermoanaerobaculaceae bacterium]